jgi:hypothetical protein
MGAVINAPTVIARFLSEIDAELRRGGGAGAAARTWEVAATFEPPDRPLRRDAEQQRLLLLADRAVRHWMPATLATLHDDQLGEIAKQPPRIRRAEDADTAARLVGGIRDMLHSRPRGPLAATPAGVASALGHVEAMLRQIVEGDPTRPEITAVTAVPHAARAVVGCYEQGAAFPDGIPGEARATVAVLDALDDERTASWGTRSRERTAHESDLHRTLVQSLMSTLANGSGEIINAEHVGTLPLPPTVGRHRPDLAGRTPYGMLFLGEAKLGPELFEEHTQEQFSDFLGFAPDGERVVLHLIVPAGWRQEAERAARAAAGSIENLVVHEVGGLPGAAAPR